MFGYIVPDKPNMYIKDYALYRSVYCGICVATGKEYGQFARLTTNYDVVFLSALIHNYLGVDFDVEERKCVLHPIKKRAIAKSDAITEKICAANVLLVYYNLLDDILDEGGLKKRIARSNLKSKFKKARKSYPKYDSAIRVSYERLRELEKNNCDSIDMLADCFAVMMRDIARLITEETDENIDSFAYNFGKWIYLADAADDLEKDFSRKQFNPFLAAFGKFENRQQFMADFGKDVEIALYGCISAIKDSYGKLRFSFNTDLTDNIVYRGLSERTRGILEGGGGKTPKI